MHLLLTNKVLGWSYNLMQNPPFAPCWGAKWNWVYANSFWFMVSLELNNWLCHRSSRGISLLWQFTIEQMSQLFLTFSYCACYSSSLAILTDVNLIEEQNSGPPMLGICQLLPALTQLWGKSEGGAGIRVQRFNLRVIVWNCESFLSFLFITISSC